MHSLVVAVGAYAVYAIPLAAALVWWRLPRAQKPVLAAVGVLTIGLALLGITAAAALWADPRPFAVDGHPPLIPHSADNGFPSDHTTLAAAIAAAIVPWRRRLGAVLLVLAAGVGAARVAAHVHHVPDVLGGFLIGVLAAIVASLAVRAALRHRGVLRNSDGRHTGSSWENDSGRGTGASAGRSRP